MRSSPFVVLLSLSLVATALTGCLSADTAGEASISRVHTLTLTRATTERAAEHGDDAMAGLRELLTTELVVRVVEEGDYTVEYTDLRGQPQAQALTGASPATPSTITGADPLSPVVLKRGDETVAVRGGVNALWWHLGELPLGLNMTEGSRAKYTFQSRVEEALTLTDLRIEEQDAVIQSLRFDLRIPITGTSSWELTPDAGEGSPLLIAGEIRVPAGAGDLVTLDVIATQGGVPGTAGFIGGVEEAVATGSAKLWVKNGEPVAAQFLGGQAKAAPRATMWADGFFAEIAAPANCAGSSKADRCSPQEIESMDETIPAEDKEIFSRDDLPRAEDEASRNAIALVQRLFAQDIVPGDKVTVIARADSQDFGGSPAGGPTGDAVFEFSLEAIEIEDVAVPAGRFSALKIIEETRTRVDVAQVPGPDGETLVDAFHMDETVARTTFWLDARTYQPIKMTAETPFNAEAILKNALNSIEPTFWDEYGGKPIEDSQWSLTAVAESSYELAEHTPGTHFSALVGLGLAHAISGSLAANSVFGIFGQSMGGTTMPHETREAYEEMPKAPPRSLALRSEEPAVGGLKSYQVTAASSEMMWGDLGIIIDGEDLSLEVGEVCAPPSGGFTVCHGGKPADYDHFVEAGATLTVRASPGDMMRVIDYATNTVVLRLTVS